VPAFTLSARTRSLYHHQEPADEENMSETVTDNNFNVSAIPATGTVKITLSKDGRELGFVEINRNKASALAATILGVAGRAFQLSGQPMPTEKEVDLTVCAASGINIGPGRTAGTAILHFYFGDTVLGIELPKSALKGFGQKLMTVGADEGKAQ
jgi:hypothetical protein